jgi:CubicO group peptidase (beta-lactamase class C family)
MELIISEIMNLELVDKEVKKIFADFDSLSTPGGVIGIIQDGKFVYKKAFGAANLEHRVPNDFSTNFCIASISKSFTGMCIGLLEEWGKLRMEDPIQRFLPDFPTYEVPITIYHLLHHTSGIKDYFYFAYYIMGIPHLDHISEEEAYSLLKNQSRLNFLPGDRYEYSNSNFFLLSLILKAITGENLATFAKQQIFDPLKMKTTQFRSNVSDIIPNKATGYANFPIYQHPPKISPVADQLKKNRKFYRYDSPVELMGDDGMWISLDEFLKWDQNFYENKIGNKGQDFIQKLLQPGILNSGEKTEYGYGFGLDKIGDYPYFCHNGCIFGFTSVYLQVPSKNFSLIWVTNTNALYAFEHHLHLLKIYLELPQDNKPAKISLDSIQKDSIIRNLNLTGRYFDSQKMHIWDIQSENPSEKGILRIKENNDATLYCYVTNPNKLICFSNLKNPNPIAEWNILYNPDQSVKGFSKQENETKGHNLEKVKEEQPFSKIDNPFHEYEGIYYCHDLETFYSVSSEEGGVRFNNRNLHRPGLNVLFSPLRKDFFLTRNPTLWQLIIQFRRNSQNVIVDFCFRQFEDQNDEKVIFIKQ